MAEIILDSFPFDSMEVLNTESGQMEDDRLYEAKIFREYFKKYLSNGVYFGDYKGYKENSMKVILDGGMNIKVKAGAGLIEGADFENTEDKILSLERPITSSRIDRIVVQFNTTLDTRATKLLIKQGSGTTPAELRRDENVYEICLAEVTVKSTSNIEEPDIVDKRTNKELCGIVNSLISVDGEELYQRFQEYIQSIKDNLMLKDQDNICTGKIIAQGGIKGDVEGSATKLNSARNISLIGDIVGDVDFDGSKDVTIETRLDNIKVLTGTMQANDTPDIFDTITYPEGFSKDNCVVIASMLQNSDNIDVWGIGATFDASGYIAGSMPHRICLNENGVTIFAKNINITNNSNEFVFNMKKDFNYKIVLMKIPQEV